MVEEYLSAKKEDLQRQLDYNFINNAGYNISDLLRGKIQMLDEIINLRNIFDLADKIEKEPSK